MKLSAWRVHNPANQKPRLAVHCGVAAADECPGATAHVNDGVSMFATSRARCCRTVWSNEPSRSWEGHFGWWAIPGSNQLALRCGQARQRRSHPAQSQQTAADQRLCSEAVSIVASKPIGLNGFHASLATDSAAEQAPDDSAARIGLHPPGQDRVVGVIRRAHDGGSRVGVSVPGPPSEPRVGAVLRRPRCRRLRCRCRGLPRRWRPRITCASRAGTPRSLSKERELLRARPGVRVVNT